MPASAGLLELAERKRPAEFENYGLLLTKSNFALLKPLVGKRDVGKACKRRGAAVEFERGVASVCA